jgi:hypothetical protein
LTPHFQSLINRNCTSFSSNSMKIVVGTMFFKLRTYQSNPFNPKKFLNINKNRLPRQKIASNKLRSPHLLLLRIGTRRKERKKR